MDTPENNPTGRPLALGSTEGLGQLAEMEEGQAVRMHLPRRDGWPGFHGTWYSPDAVREMLAAERERWLMLCEQALAALVWEAGSEPALYAAQTAAAIDALRSSLGPCVYGRA